MPLNMNPFEMLKTMGSIQSQMKTIKEELAKITATGSAGAGLVEAVVNGEFMVQRISISDSAMAMNDKSRPGTDVCVLNSVNNLNRSLPYLQRHKKINVFFDNDEAGRMALKQLEERFGKDAVQDMSSLYAPHKDLNEYLVSIRRKFLKPKF